MCGLLFFGIAYSYLQLSLNGAFSTDNKDQQTPYKIYPKNSGVAIVLDDGSAVLAYLDFKNNNIKLVDIPQFDKGIEEYNGFSVDYTVQTNSTLLEGVIDRVGGVNLKCDGKKMRYTGNQVVELISNGCENELKQQLFLQIFNQIAKNDFSKSDFVYIMENSKSNLSIVECITWIDYLPDMCENISFVN